MIYQLPIPKSSELFELILCDLLNLLYNTTSFSTYGRKGQNQEGIDIISYEKSIVCQCKLRNLNLYQKNRKIEFINEIIKDINNIILSDRKIKKIIIATTIENDTVIQDQLNTITLLNGVGITIEFWSWDNISNNLFLFNNLINKYFPFRDKAIELANIQVLNKSIYKKSKENERLFIFQNIKNRNQLPVFDFTFINHTENTIILKSINIYCHLLSVAKGGFYDEPAGILKVTKKYNVSLKTGSLLDDFDKGKTIIDLDDPLYAFAKVAFRIQIQCKKPIITYKRIVFEFNFNTMTIKSPELYFNSDYAISGKIVREI